MHTRLIEKQNGGRRYDVGGACFVRLPRAAVTSFAVFEHLVTWRRCQVVTERSADHNTDNEGQTAADLFVNKC